MPGTLRKQVQGLSVLPLLALTGIVILLSVFLTKQQVDAEASRNLQEVTRLLATTTRERSELMSAQTRLLAGTPVLQSALARGDRAVLTERANFFVKNSPAQAVVITNSEGKVLAKAGSVHLARLDPQFKTLIRRALKGNTAS